MNRVLQRRLLALTLLLCIFGTLGANIGIDPTVLNNSNDLFSATVPISYGEQSFRERILARTHGERDPIGLVLSGGSARAFAHIGVLQYIEELGIVPDFIISNSMGSIVGILYAAGLSPEQIDTLSSQIDITRLFDISFPIRGGLLDTSRFLSLVAQYLGADLQLEHLPIPIMIVSEDIATRRQVRIMEGDLLTVLGAAFALPVYFNPVEYNGHLLVDGGVTNLVPLDIAYEYTDTTIVSTTFYDAKGINLRNPLSILNVSIDLGKRRDGVAALLGHTDAIWIRCDVEDFSFMDFGAIEELAQRGYRSAALQEERLSSLDARGTTKEMRDFRSAFSTRQDKVLSDYRLYKRFPHHGVSQQMFFGLRSFIQENDHWYLRDEVLAGLMYHLRWKSMWFSLYGGAGWESFSPMAVYPSLTASLSYQLAAPLVLEADISISAQESWLPSWYHRLGMQLRKGFFSDSLMSSAQFWWEHQVTNEFELEAMLLHAGLDFSWSPHRTSRLRLSGEGAWQLAGDWDRQFLHTRFNATFPLPSDFRLDVGYTGRYALDGAGNVPLYLGDGFKTSDPVLRSQGSLDALAPSSANFAIVGRFGLDWQPQWFKPTMGELLIFDDSCTGIFGDLLWNVESQIVPELSFGTRLTTTISLLGLNSMPTSLYVGYDGPADGIVWGFIFGR